MSKVGSIVFSFTQYLIVLLELMYQLVIVMSILLSYTPPIINIFKFPDAILTVLDSWCKPEINHTKITHLINYEYLAIFLTYLYRFKRPMI